MQSHLFETGFCNAIEFRLRRTLQLLNRHPQILQDNKAANHFKAFFIIILPQEEED